MENKYGVNIDTSEFESNRENEHFKTIVTYDNSGEAYIEYYDDYIRLDGLTLIGGLLTHGSRVNQHWSEVPEMDLFFKHEGGLSNQMQIFLTTNPLGASLTIWLRIKSDEPNKDVYYDLTIVAEEKIDFTFERKGCNVEDMAEAIKQIPAILNVRE